MAALVRRLYGAPLAHLILLVAAFALTGYTISVVGVAGLFAGEAWWHWIAVWFAAAIIAHDLILFPVYARADQLLPRARRLSADRRGEPAPGSGRIGVTNYMRMPTLAAGLLLLMFFPGIIEQGAAAFNAATGLTQTPYLTRWLLLTAAFYLISALCYMAKTIL